MSILTGEKVFKKASKFAHIGFCVCQSQCTMLESLSWLEFSGTEHLVEVLDKLSSTSLDFFRSERELECMCLYGV